MSLEEVAKRARVSPATVSRVLNGLDVVKSSTRARVTKAMAELKYYPNLHARSLAGGRNRTIGVIVSNLDNPFFLDVYRTVESDCHAHGYEVLLANTSYRPEQLATSIRLMIGRRVAGLAAIVSEMDDAIIQELIDSHIPIVFYDVGTPGENITKIRVDYVRGVESIIEHLTGLGHREFGFVDHHSGLGPINERRIAVINAVERICPEGTVRCVADNDSLDGGCLAARELIDSGPLPTAIVAVNDLMALGVLKELRVRGLRVPEDVSLTGYDNIKLSEYCHPALTTVHIPRDQIGHSLFTSLAPELKTPETTGCELVITPEFLLRDSTAPPRTSTH